MELDGMGGRRDSKVTKITGDRDPGSWGQKQSRRSTMEYRRRGEGSLVEEWGTLNSALLKQLFDRHYTLACGWCQHLLAVWSVRKKRAYRTHLMDWMYNTCPIQISKRNPRNPLVWRRSLRRIKRIFRPKRRKNKSAKEEICLASGHRRGLAFLGQPFQISESERGLQERKREREEKKRKKKKKRGKKNLLRRIAGTRI